MVPIRKVTRPKRAFTWVRSVIQKLVSEPGPEPGLPGIKALIRWVGRRLLLPVPSDGGFADPPARSSQSPGDLAVPAEAGEGHGPDEFILAGWTGLEPATSDVTGRRSN